MKAIISLILAVAILLLVPFDTLLEVMAMLAVAFGLATIFYMQMYLIQSKYERWKRKKKWK